MQSIYQKISKGFALALCAMVLLPMAAEAAGQAGNTIIRNTVSVAYSDAAGTAQTAVTDSVDVTVTTVNALPSIVSISPASGISTTSTGDTYAYAVTVRTNSNGPGTIALTAADTVVAAANTGGLTVSATGPSFSAASLFLGSTTFDPTDASLGAAQTIAAAGNLTIKVPNDGGKALDTAATGGATGDNVINALAVNDTVYITDGTNFFGPFTITAVTDPAVGTGVTAAPGTLALTNGTTAAIGPFTPAAGWMIVESKVSTMTVTQGSLATPANTSNYLTTISLAMGGSTGVSATTVTTTATAGSLTVVKYVRNVTTSAAGTGVATSITVNGAASTYYIAGVGAKPTDILEYAIQITNNGAANATVVIATDNVPAYTTLVAGATFGTVGAGTAAHIFAIADDGTATNISLTMQATDDEATTLASGGAVGITAGSALTLYVGTGNADTTNTGGTIAAAGVYTIIYQVKVD